MTITLEQIKQTVTQELLATDQLILESLSSGVALVEHIGHYITKSHGKRLRPLLAILAAKALQATSDDDETNALQDKRATTIATIIEFIHNATLLHDDVVDESDLRRGHKTANLVWNNAASILVGDFLYSRAFQLMTSLDNLAVMKVLADATNRIAEGEVLQLMHCNDPKTTEADYYKVIEHKTATLFSAACRLGAVINHAPDSQAQALANYGLHLGNAFQIIDDILDYTANTEVLGKNIGDDLAEGKPTLPLIYALAHSSGRSKTQIHQAIATGNTENLTEILQTVQQSGALDYAKQQAQQQVGAAIHAIANLPHTLYKECLVHIAELSLTREF